MTASPVLRSQPLLCQRRLEDTLLLAGILVIWALVQGGFWHRLIYHDTWLYNFPVLAAISRSMACSGMPDWLGGVNSGTPMALYTSSFSLTNPIRLPLLFFHGVRLSQAARGFWIRHRICLGPMPRIHQGGYLFRRGAVRVFVQRAGHGARRQTSRL